MAYRWVGLDAEGRTQRFRSHASHEFWKYLNHQLDAGFTSMTIVDEETGVEVAGIADMGGGHSEAWVKS